MKSYINTVCNIHGVMLVVCTWSHRIMQNVVPFLEKEATERTRYLYSCHHSRSVQCINNKHNDNDRESEDGPFDMTAWMGVTRHRRERYIIGQERSGTMIRRINDLSVPQTH